MPKRIILFLVLSFFVVGLSGCQPISDLKSQLTKSKKAKSLSIYKPELSPASVMRDENVYDKESNEQVSDAPKAQAKGESPVSRKIIYSAHIRLQVQDVPASIDKIKIISRKMQAYIGSSSVSKDENKLKYGQVILRVPPKTLDLALAQIKVLGDVLDESLKGEDVSKYYYDLQARLKNNQQFEARILKLLQTKTTKIKDVLEVETELARVRQNIEELQGELNYYKNLISMATIEISLAEKGTVLPQRGNILQPIIDTFAEAFSGFFASLGDIVIISFVFIPWLVFVIILFFILRVFWRKIRGK